MSALGKPRPVEEQTWRRHHWLRVPQERPVRSATSGCARRRRKAIERRTRWEDGTYGVVVIEIGPAR